MEQRFGGIDVLVNNASVGYFGAFEESDLGAVRAMFEINFWGLANMSRAVLPGMRQRRAGTIFNISSVGACRSRSPLRALGRRQRLPRDCAQARIRAGPERAPADRTPPAGG